MIYVTQAQTSLSPKSPWIRLTLYITKGKKLVLCVGNRKHKTFWD